MAEYKPIDELYKVDFRDLDVFSIDVLTDVPIIKILFIRHRDLK